MTTFLKVNVKSVTPGAVFEGRAYDYYLEAVTAIGDSLEIYDYNPPLSSILSDDDTLELVVVAGLIGGLRLDDQDDVSDWRYAAVSDLDWRGMESSFRVFRPELLERQWLLVTTRVGMMLMAWSEIPENLRPQMKLGSHLSWQAERLDLYAIL